MKPIKGVLVISDKPDKEHMMSAARLVFESLSLAIYGVTDYKLLKADQRQVVQDSMYVVSLEHVVSVGEGFEWGDWDAVVGFGAKVSEYLKFGRHTDLLYRLNKKVISLGNKPGTHVTYWGFISSFKIKLLYQYPDDPESMVELRRGEKAIGLCYNAILGFESVSTMTETVFINTPEDIKPLIDYCNITGEICFDFETFPKLKGLTKSKDIKDHSLDPHKAQASMLGISFQVGSGYIIPIYHCESPWNIGCDDDLEYVSVQEKDEEGILVVNMYVYKNGEPLERYNGELVMVEEDNKVFIDALFSNWGFVKREHIPDLLHDFLLPEINEEIFKKKDIRKVAHNIKFDLSIGRQLDIEVEGRLDDTLIMHHTIREDVPHGLKKIAPQLYPEFEGYGDEVDYANDSLRSLGNYCANDNDLTLRARYLFEYELLKDPKLYRVYRNYETSKLRLLGDMEYKGMPVDTDVLEEGLSKCTELLQEVTEELNNMSLVKRFIRYEKDRIDQEMIQDLTEKISKAEGIKLKELIISQQKMESEDKVYSKRKDKETDEYILLKSYSNVVEKRQLVLDQNYYSLSYPYKNIVTWKIKIDKLKSGEVNNFESINFNSPTQLGKLIYTSKAGLNYELPVVTRTIKDPITKRMKKETGPYPSTNKDILGLFPDPTKLIERVLEYRLLSTAKSTYFEGIRSCLDNEDKVHSTFGTARSQRITSNNPNLQNIPSRTSLERVKETVSYIKRMFCTPLYDTNKDDPYEFFQADLSQSELRWCTYLWRVDTMAEALADDIDLHVLASCSGTNVSLDDYCIMLEEDIGAAEIHRHKGKAKNFGLIYVMSAESYREYSKIQYGIEMSMEQARKEHKDYLYTLHPAIPKAHELYRSKANRYGWVRTAYGSKRFTPFINSNDPGLRSHDERIGVNSPVQGSSGQGLLFSCIVHQDRMSILQYDGDLLNTVHDSGLGYVRRSQMDLYLRWLLKAFNNPPNMEYFGFEFDNVEMKSDVEVGPNWKDLKEIDIVV